MPGFDSGLFSSAITSKYANQTRDSQSEAALRAAQGYGTVTDANSMAGLRGSQGRQIDKQTSNIDANDAATRDEAYARAFQDRAVGGSQANLLNQQGFNLRSMLGGELGAQGDASRESTARTAGLEGQNNINAFDLMPGSTQDRTLIYNLLNPGASGGGGGIAAMLQQLMARSNGGGGTAFSEGTPAVAPQQVDQGKDTVPAMLRPHEAVLVPGAADAIGRDKIAALNAVHNAKDQVKPQSRGGGMPKPGGRAHFDDGTSSVTPGSGSGSDYVGRAAVSSGGSLSLAPAASASPSPSASDGGLTAPQSSPGFTDLNPGAAAPSSGQTFSGNHFHLPGVTALPGGVFERPMAGGMDYSGRAPGTTFDDTQDRFVSDAQFNRPRNPTSGLGYSRGTPSVPGGGMPKPKGKGAPVHAANGSVDITSTGRGVAQGTTGPGQTVTSGSWAPAPSLTPNQDLRSKMAGSMTTKNYAQGTHDVGNDAAMTPQMPSPAIMKAIQAIGAPGASAGQSMGKTGGKPAKPSFGKGMPPPKAKKVA